MSLRLVALCAAAGALTAFAAAGSGSGATARTKTLLTTTGPIRAFTQDAARIAWIDAGWKVRVRALRTGNGAVLGSARPWGREAKNGIPPQLAIAGSRVLWTSSGGGDSLETDVYSNELGTRKRPRLVGGDQADLFVGVGDGGYFGAMAGNGSTLLWSSLFYRCADDACTQLAVPTNFEAHFDGTFRVVSDSKVRRLSGTRGGFKLALYGNRVAVLPSADPIRSGSHPGVSPGTTVDIRDAATGALVSRFTPPGTVRALALSGTVAAVVDEAQDGSRTIERYDAASGTLLGASPLAAGGSLAVSGDTVVFVAGKTIEAMDAETGDVRTLAPAGGVPVGLSAVGKRIAWAVNAHGRARVLAVTLP